MKLCYHSLCRTYWSSFGCSWHSPTDKMKFPAIECYWFDYVRTFVCAECTCTICSPSIDMYWTTYVCIRMCIYTCSMNLYKIKTMSLLYTHSGMEGHGKRGWRALSCFVRHIHPTYSCAYIRKYTHTQIHPFSNRQLLRKSPHSLRQFRDIWQVTDSPTCIHHWFTEEGRQWAVETFGESGLIC